MDTMARTGTILESDEALAAIVRAMRTVAVVGMKGDDRPDAAAFAIPQKLQARGAVTPKQLEDAQAGLEMSEARLDQSKAQLDKLRRGARSEEIDAVQATLEQTRAQVGLLQKRLADAEVKALMQQLSKLISAEVDSTDPVPMVTPAREILPVTGM